MDFGVSDSGDGTQFLRLVLAVPWGGLVWHLDEGEPMNSENPILRGPGRDFSVNEATRRRNPSLFGSRLAVGQSSGVSTPLAPQVTASLIATIKARKKPKMTRCEARFWGILKHRFPSATITPQFRLRVSAWDAPIQVHYMADFLVSEEKATSMFPNKWEVAWKHTLFECKDSRRKPHSDELTRPKMARQNNIWISAVVLATFDGEKWTEKQIA